LASVLYEFSFVSASCSDDSTQKGDKATTFPIIIRVGETRSAEWTSSTRSFNVANTIRCWGVVPRSTATAGVFGGRPCFINFGARDGSVDRPIYTTKVVSGSAAFSATNRGSVPPFLECPVKNLTLVATPRWVSGIPSSAAIPEAEVIPGITSTLIPCCCRKSISSPPLPKTRGSPPFSRTTLAPASAKLRSSS